LAYQSSLEKKYEKLTNTRIVFVDLSVSETLHNLTVLASTHPTEKANLLNELTKIQKQFKVPDKRFWHVKVRALAMSQQWDELRRFANEKKSPIG
jgi:vacuolar protein sorting-associated protein 16